MKEVECWIELKEEGGDLDADLGEIRFRSKRRFASEKKVRTLLGICYLFWNFLWVCTNKRVEDIKWVLKIMF